MRTTSWAKALDLALEFFHPVSRQLGPVALRIAEDSRADIGDANVGFAPVAIQGSQHVIIGRLAAHESLGRVGVARALDPHDPVAGSSQEDHLTGQRVVPAPDIVDVDLPGASIRCESWRRSVGNLGPRPAF